jgi:hypothetical protein
MADLLNFRYDFVNPEDGSWGHIDPETGDWNGLVAQAKSIIHLLNVGRKILKGHKEEGFNVARTTGRMGYIVLISHKGKIVERAECREDIGA